MMLPKLWMSCVNDLLGENAAAADRDLAELQKFMADVREDKRLGAKEEQLLQEGGTAPECKWATCKRNRRNLPRT